LGKLTAKLSKQLLQEPGKTERLQSLTMQGIHLQKH
ncbi:hypothetical protein T11_13326, partial [Trichinella zimbabwensis]